jgi:hypothetical protein
MSTQFVKNTNTPPRESSLWSVGEGWKRSEKGNDYTSLSQITNTQLGAELCNQFEASKKEPIAYVNHFFVPSYSQNGKFLIYAFPDQVSAEKKAKWEKPVTVPADLDFRERGSGQGQEQEQPLKIAEQAFGTQQSNTAAASTVISKPPQVIHSQKTVQVVTDVTPVKCGDISTIGELEQRGLYVLPIIHVGNNRFCFEDKEGNYILLYGRIINVKIDDN